MIIILNYRLMGDLGEIITQIAHIKEVIFVELLEILFFNFFNLEFLARVFTQEFGPVYITIFIQLI